MVIIGANRPRLYATMLAAQALGAIPMPLYQDAVGAECVFPINNADVRFAWWKTRSRSTSCWRCAASARSWRRSGYDDPRGLRNYSEPGLQSLDSAAGSRPRAFAASAQPGFFQGEVDKASPDDVAAMFFTSGTTGNPKGVVHTHRTLLDRAKAGADFDKLTEPRKCWPTCRRPGSARTSSAMRSGWPAATWSTAPSRRHGDDRPEGRSGRPTTSRRRASSKACSPR
jgi:long-chain acyl-CoA synthetase